MWLLYRRIHGIFFTNPLHSSRTLLVLSRTYATPTPVSHKSIKRLPDPDLFKERDLRKMVDKFKMLCEDITYRNWRYATYSKIVRCLAAHKQFSWIEEIFDDQKKYCVAIPEFAERLISFYGKAGMFEHARDLFDEMPKLKCKRTVKSFNTLLEACYQTKNYHETLLIFHKLPKRLRITPNVASYTTVLRAHSELGSVDELLPTVKKMYRKGLKPDSTAYGFLLQGLYRHGRVSEAVNVWESFRGKGVTPCIRCYTSKLELLVAEKKMKGATKLFFGLEGKGMMPDKATFSAMFKGFCDARNLEEAKKLYEMMTKNKCRPNHFIHEILVPFATEMGDFEFVLKLCLAANDLGHFLSQEILQGVVDGLVKESKIEEAKQLMDSILDSHNPVTVSIVAN